MNKIIKSLDELLPTYETILPFCKQQVSFVPFKVKDAKTISIILQEDNKKLALKIMVELLKTNIKNLNIEDLYLADAEFLFLQIRSKSVEEVLHLIHNNEKVQIPISEIKYRNKPKTQQIEVGNHIVLYLETPKIKDLLKLDALSKENLIRASIKKIVVKNEIYDLAKFVSDDIKNILDNLPLSVVPKIDAFFKEQPELFVKLNTDNTEKEVTGLLNFFIYR